MGDLKSGRDAEGALGKKELITQVTPNQGGQANQAASEQDEQTGFRNDGGSNDGRRGERIRSQDQDKQSNRAQVSHRGKLLSH